MFSITYVEFSMYKTIYNLQYIDATEKIAPPFDAEVNFTLETVFKSCVSILVR